MLNQLSPDELSYIEIDEYFKVYTSKGIEDQDANEMIFKAYLKYMYGTLNQILENKNIQEKLTFLANEIKSTTGQKDFKLNSLNYFHKEFPDNTTSIIYGIAKSEYYEGEVKKELVILQSITSKLVNNRVIMIIYLKRMEDFEKDFHYLKTMSNKVANGFY